MQVLPSAYFPSLAYVRALLLQPNCLLDPHEHFIKQSIRTRCEILTANGVLQLNVPVLHNGKQPVSNIEIDYTRNWQQEHLRAIESAYANAPHFEFYFYDLQQLFLLRPQYLCAFNDAILAWIDQALGLALKVEKSDKYTGQVMQEKKAWLGRTLMPTSKYVQVFSQNDDFVANLSVIDGLMNEGPLLRSHFLPG